MVYNINFLEEAWREGEMQVQSMAGRGSDEQEQERGDARWLALRVVTKCCCGRRELWPLLGGCPALISDGSTQRR